MADFVSWDHAAPPTGSGDTGPQGVGLDTAPVQDDNHDFDLALANIDGDDFSFWALEHFETSNLASGIVPAGPKVTSLTLRELQNTPCEACDAGGFDCKQIAEGECKGCCTTCVALGIVCSFQVAHGAGNLDRKMDGNAKGFLEDVQRNEARGSSSPDIAHMNTGTNSGNDNSPKPPAIPKIGARFSRESVRILKTWLSTHAQRPYPTDEERENLQIQTGLNKTQITNWLANARRRSKGKVWTRSKSPSVRGWSGAVEIPQRRGTPAAEHMSPLQRWENSPPENEPASVTAIATAIMQSKSTSSNFGSDLNSPFILTDDEAARSCKGSSASSFGTSPSSGSFASAYSRQSGGSLASLGSLQQRGRRRRRRRTAPKKGDEKGFLGAPLKTFQCTFCTETFRTKHDWQRHEKSLHLSLERWVCCPQEPIALSPQTAKVCCVFCSAVDPDTAHIESHNYSSCQGRQLDERTFYRKDHLRQHLRLVHETKYLSWSMDSWKVQTPDIRSRCGFCDKFLYNWPARVDHLAEHFKTGSDMANWKGDWGFEAAVLSMVENAIPPYLIHVERTLPLPYQASQQAPGSPPHAYELLKIELAFYMENKIEDDGAIPPDDKIQYEACRVIYSSEVLAKSGLASQKSWLRDILMSSDEPRTRARMSPIRGPAESCLSHLRINGKDNIFEGCPLERQLVDLVKARALLGLSASDEELQVEACKIIGRMEESSSIPSENFANFLVRLIHRTTTWLSDFRQRCGLPAPEETEGAKTKPTTNSTIHNYSQLEHELAGFLRNQRAMGMEPSNDELQQHARCVVYNCQDSWQETAADNAGWLTSFKQRNDQHQHPELISSSRSSPLGRSVPTVPDLTMVGSNTSPASPGLPFDSGAISLFGSDNAVTESQQSSNNFRRYQFMRIGGPNSYSRLAKELGRYVAAAMSPNNPNQHIPSDDQIRYQARWIEFDDDDPLNHTAADIAEWLLRFKRSVGILPAIDGPGLSGDIILDTTTEVWKGLSTQTPETSLTEPAVPHLIQDATMINKGMGNSSEFDPMSDVQKTNNDNAQDIGLLSEPGAVFANREFEDQLVRFAVAEVASSGKIPADEAIQARAKEISGLEVWQAETTSADDPMLLEKFKHLVVEKVKAVLGGHDDDGSIQQKAQISIKRTSSTHARARGMDAIDPGLLPALECESKLSRENNTLPSTRNFKVAISEKRLDEIIMAMGPGM